MLTLARRQGETIKIGDNITVTIVRLGPKSVVIGFDAPKDVPIHRQEVYDRIRQNDAFFAPDNGDDSAA